MRPRQLPHIDFGMAAGVKYLATTCRQAFLDAGLAGASFTERVEDAPDGAVQDSVTGSVRLVRFISSTVKVKQSPSTTAMSLDSGC